MTATAVRVISVDEEWTKECKPLIDWLKLHDVNPDDCFKVETFEDKVTFWLYVRNPETGKLKLRLYGDGRSPHIVTTTESKDLKVPLEEVGI